LLGKALHGLPARINHAMRCHKTLSLFRR